VTNPTARARRRWARRALAVVAVSALTAALPACAPPLPDTVVSGSSVVAAWSGGLTSTNPASRGGATAGGADVAALTRARFAQTVDGADVVDEAFGTVTIVDPESFTVRYDLAEPRWSDGIPVDAADLLLAWAAGSNAFAPEGFDGDDARPEGGALSVPGDVPWFDSLPTGLARSEAVTGVDEFGRSIDVRFAEPVVDWRTALEVSVPAHVVGRLAFDVDDPMEAKQRVADAVRRADRDALAEIARAWNTAFELPERGEVPAGLLLSSGPYRVTAIDRSNPERQRVELTVNPQYAGAPTGQYERIELQQAGADERLDGVGDALDVVQIAPTAADRDRVRELERTDYGVATTHDGTVWTLLVRGDRGRFSATPARQAFLRAVPRQDVTATAAGEWAEQYEGADTVLFAPGTSGYEIALEDAGLRETLERSASEATADREAAGVPAGTAVCVLYDTRSEFARGAFAAMRARAAESGWDVRDCGQEDAASALAVGGEWDAALARLPLPGSAAEVASWWGSDGPAWLRGDGRAERDALIASLARASDEYEARDLRVQIEATIVRDAVALPLAMNPVVTIAAREVTGVRPRPGAVASLTSGAVDWAPAAD